MRSCSAVAALLVLGCVVVGAQDSHDSHTGEDRFEAALAYELEIGTNSLILTPAEGSFTEETLSFMVVQAATADSGGLEEAEESAEAGAVMPSPTGRSDPT